jgi:EmrB/QacA subfamily drug resistance transporter
MSEQTRRSWVDHLSSLRPGGWEPAPAEFLARLSCYPWIVVATTCVAAFIGQLDASIVQLTLPTLEREFLARLSAVSWVAIAYQLAFAATLPVFARLAEITGRKLMYLTGFALFALASALCGLTSDLIQLIAFRALQGVGGAMLGANSIVILVKAAGADRQGSAMGIFAGAQAVGISVGPLAGGVLLAVLDWRWVFWASVPFAFAAIVIGWLVIPKTAEFDTDRRFDGRGAVLLMPALILLLLVISESYAWDPISPAILGGIVGVVFLLGAFIRHESRAPAPLIDLDLFRIVPFAGGTVAIVLSYALLYAMLFLMSFAFVRGYHDLALAAGLRLAIIPVALGLVAPFTDALQKRLGARRLLLSGMAICVVALIVLSTTLSGTAASLAGVMVALALYGVGLGLFIAPNNSLTLTAAPDNRRGEAGGLLNLMRTLGMSLGVAGAAAMLGWRLGAATGIGDHTLSASQRALLASVKDVLLMLGAAAIAAAITSALRVPRADPTRTIS